MRKEVQQGINKAVLLAIDEYNASDEDITDVKRLRSCSASVGKKGKWYVLKSYSTIIAIIDTTTDTLFDFLRYVYGYTPTSVQHISKFDKDYGQGIWGCKYRVTYR